MILTLEHDGPLTWVTLNRPERLNALSTALMSRLDEALTELAERRATRVIAIRGAGRAFCSGYDIERDEDEIAGAAHRAPVADRLRLDRNIELFMRIWRHPKPVIAAVHGYCIAGGTQLATLCDLTVVTRSARIGMPSLPIGGGYISPMWVPLVGPKRAKQMSFQAGTHITGETAATWGWANYAVDDNALETEVRALALSIAKTPADVLTTKKLAINRAADIAGWTTVMSLGGETDALLHQSQSVTRIGDAIMHDGLKEAIRAFHDGAFADEP